LIEFEFDIWFALGCTLRIMKSLRVKFVKSGTVLNTTKITKTNTNEEAKKPQRQHKKKRRRKGNKT